MNLDAGTINVPMKDIVGSISAKVRVTGMPAFGVRTKLFILLLQVAAWIAPFKVNVELEGPK